MAGGRTFLNSLDIPKNYKIAHGATSLSKNLFVPPL